MSKYNELVKKLKEIFQIDRPELDFGIYRILNAKADEINNYLENTLKQKISEALATAGNANKEELEKQLTSAIKAAEDAGFNAEDSPKVKDIRQQIIATSQGANEHENAVFTHLLSFFSRYYDSGDFVSKRRYKGDTYAIPYAGEEVMLHWANKDQYYIKSGENFANYSFKLDDSRKVSFKLLAADIAKDNRKDNDADRRFVLVEPHTRTKYDEEGNDYDEEYQPVTVVKSDETEELVIQLEYKTVKKGTKQDALVMDALQTVLSHELVQSSWADITKREPTEKNPNRTLLEKHLTTYTQRNTADYFIHKDLGGFLSNELDFYIKNEVMNLDNVQNAEVFADIEKQLRMIQCLRSIAGDVIKFLAQIENFQKKLWTKKKFVVSTDYCVTLDKVSKKLYPEILNNKAQIETWVKLGLLERDSKLEIETLNQLQYLMIDTSLFNDSLKSQLISDINDIDNICDGVIFNSDNYQALKLINLKYKSKFKTCYIDPLYNTGRDGFLYKDAYKSSSWCTSMDSVLKASRELLSPESLLFVSNDDNENHHLKKLLQLNGLTPKTNLIWNSDGHTDNQFDIKINHEYITIAEKSQLARYGFVIDKNTRKDSNLWQNIAENSITKNGPANPFSNVLLPKGFPVKGGKGSIHSNYPTQDFFDEVSDLKYFPRNLIKKYSVSFPIREKTVAFEEGKLTDELTVCAGWANVKKLNKFINNGCKPYFDIDGVLSFYLSEKGTIYYRKEKEQSRNILSVLKGFKTTEKMKYELEQMGLEFSYPKPVDLIEYLIEISDHGHVLDFFAGSGTTAQSVINLARKSNKYSKYVLVEQNNYMDTIIKSRIQKIVFSPDWKLGKPVSIDNGLSHCFKVIKLESYEDTLNNLKLKKKQQTFDLFDDLGEDVTTDYLLNYMLETESKGSLLSTDDFKKPFDYKMKIAVDSAGAFEEQNIDLVETFNYLIGLHVITIESNLDRGYVRIEGTLPSGERALILWRDCDKWPYDKFNLETLKVRFDLNPKEKQFDVIYVNGDHNLPTAFTTEDGEITRTLKLRQIEPEFLEQMFAPDELA